MSRPSTARRDSSRGKSTPSSILQAFSKCKTCAAAIESGPGAWQLPPGTCFCLRVKEKHRAVRANLSARRADRRSEAGGDREGDRRALRSGGSTARKCPRMDSRRTEDQLGNRREERKGAWTIVIALIVVVGETT